jgi:Icc-related predicted phosphoesterase
MRSIMTGTKGFIGGFPDSALPDFGEPLLRQVYAETTAEVSALEEGLQAIADCPLRVVLLHYAPTATTLEGEPKGILAFLGSDRLARPVSEHIPDLVLHGHGHAGSFEGFIGKVPVYNVSIPVMGRDFWCSNSKEGEQESQEHPLDHHHRRARAGAARVFLPRPLVGPTTP